MKNRNTQLTAVLFVVALALAPIVQAGPQCGGGPHHSPANEAPRPDGGPVSDTNPTSPQDEQMPVIIINSTGDVSRGKTGSFVLDMKPRLMFGAMFVNFTVSGTAIPGVDYVALVSPAYIGQSGYGTILVQTLPDPRGSSNRQSYSVVIALDPGLGALRYWPSRYAENTSKRKAEKQNKTSEANFPRNLAPAFTHYLSERPEMSSQ